MKFTKTDLGNSRNMLKVLGKGKWELDGLEILAFADMMRWFSQLQRNIEGEVAQSEAEEKMKAEEDKKLEEGKLVPKVLEDPIKQIEVKPIKMSKKKSE